MIFFLIFIVPSFWGSLPEIEFLLLEHRLYLPIIGFLIAIGGVKEFGDSIDNSPIFLLILSTVIILFLFINIKHQESYRNRSNFWQNAVNTSPNLSRSHFGMGTYYKAIEDYKNAEREYLLANKLNPKQGGVKNNLGALYLDLGRLTEAKKLFEEELIERKDPTLFFNYGLTLYRLGEYSKAKSAWLEGLKIDPDNIALLTKMFLYESENKNIFGAEYYRNELLKRNVKI
jgi:tetratricopeptide (TPR) repeat protein